MTTPGTTPGTDFATDALRRCALFAQFTDEALDTCARSLRVRRFPFEPRISYAVVGD